MPGLTPAEHRAAGAAPPSWLAAAAKLDHLGDRTVTGSPVRGVETPRQKTAAGAGRKRWKALALTMGGLAALAILALSVAWWLSISRPPPTDPEAMAQLLDRVRIAPMADLPLRDRLALEKDLLQADASSQTAVAAARSAALLQALGLLLQAGTVIAAIVLAVIGWRNLEETRRKIDEDRAATEQRLTVDREGQITNRFTQAITQIGAEKNGKPNLEVRLGGIYALERIAKDSPRDHWTIMEVLTAYVRENAPWPPHSLAEANSNQEVAPPASRSDALIVPASTVRAKQVLPERAEFPLPKPRTDVQAILTVLGRCEPPKRLLEPDRLNLSSTDLRGADFSNAHLERANFAGARLGGALFGRAHLEGANFRDAHLEGVIFAFSHLEGANFYDAHLEGVGFWEAHLKGANFAGARLGGALFGRAHLEGAGFVGAHLEGANFQGAHLEGAGFAFSHLEGASFLDASGLTPERVLIAHEQGRGAVLPEVWSDAAREAVWARWPEGVAVWKQRQQEAIEALAVQTKLAEAEPAAVQAPTVPGNAAASVHQSAPASLVPPPEANGAVVPPHERTPPETPPPTNS